MTRRLPHPFGERRPTKRIPNRYFHARSGGFPNVSTKAESPGWSCKSPGMGYWSHEAPPILFSPDRAWSFNLSSHSPLIRWVRARSTHPIFLDGGTPRDAEACAGSYCTVTKAMRNSWRAASSSPSSSGVRFPSVFCSSIVSRSMACFACSRRTSIFFVAGFA
jgi:hypothetical protein